MRFEFPRHTVRLDAFQGRPADWITENSGAIRGRQPRFSRRGGKRVVKEEFPINDSGRMQGFCANLRATRSVCALRRAFNYAYDFAEMNKSAVL